MSLFAEFSPDPRREPRLESATGLSIRPARAVDLRALAAIAAERDGGPVAERFERLREALSAVDSGESLVLVADLDRRVVGYGRAGYFRRPASTPPNTVPDGWYLTGVVVSPRYRRRGIGAALTRDRLAWIEGRSSEAFYVASARNPVTIALHAAFGFKEMARGIHHPGVRRFTGGIGILFQAQLQGVEP